MTTLRKLPQIRPNARAMQRRSQGGKSSRRSTLLTTAARAARLLSGEAEHHGEGGLELLARRLHRRLGEGVLELDHPGAEVLVHAARALRGGLGDPAFDDLAQLVEVAFAEEL